MTEIELVHRSGTLWKFCRRHPVATFSLSTSAQVVFRLRRFNYEFAAEKTRSEVESRGRCVIFLSVINETSCCQCTFNELIRYTILQNATFRENIINEMKSMVVFTLRFMIRISEKFYRNALYYYKLAARPRFRLWNISVIIGHQRAPSE